MNKRRVYGVFFVLIGCCLIIIIGIATGKERLCVITDGKGETVAKVFYQDNKIKYECEDIYNSFIDVVCKEAVEIVQKKENIGKKSAQKKLVKDQMHIKTELNTKILEVLKMSHDKFKEIQNNNFAVAFSDVNGRFLACYSASPKKEINYVTYPTFAGSTMKPLSVYAPAIEDKMVDWSSMYLDTAYTSIKDENGDFQGWPVNAEPYTNQPQTVESAMKSSNNAIAVKVLKEYGVEKSCEFLKRGVDLNLNSELQKIKQDGEDSVLGSIALGYLEKGVTVEDMVGYYQVFANGGEYYNVHAIEAIQERDGNSYFEHKNHKQRLFSIETAYIVNRLLKTVVEKDGTGEGAYVKGVDVVGKTGTSSNFRDNWFVGETPEYVCAVWYGKAGEFIEEKNKSATIFNYIMSNTEHQANVKYPVSKKIVQRSYCELTGKITGLHCKSVKKGYYSMDNIPEECICK